LAFSTIQGSGGAPDSFVGTSGVDNITLINSTGNYFLGAQEANDNITYVADRNNAGVITNSTQKGGSGNDTFIASSAIIFSGTWFNGNAGADSFSFNAASLLSASSLHGGQGGDQINTGGVVNGLVNGNIGDDTIAIGAAVGGAATSSASSFFGGQGNDTINVNVNATNSLISGDIGNDNIVTGAVSVAGSTLNGGQGNDTITAATATTASLINGGENNDNITGSAFNDTLNGDEGNDTIATTGGNDTVTGGSGNDVIGLAVGAGRDRVVYGSSAAANGADAITGFAVGAATAANLADVASFTAFINGGGVAPVGFLNIAANPGAATLIDDDVVVLADIPVGQDITTAAGLTTALAVGGEYANLNMSANETAVAITYVAGAATGNNGFAFYLTSDAAGTITATSVGTITTDGAATWAGAVAANFLV